MKEIIDIELKAKSLKRSENFDEFIELCELGVELDSNNVYFLYNLANHYLYDLGDFEKSCDYFKRCIENGDNKPRSHENYLKLLISTGKTPDKFDKKLIKKYFWENKKLCQYHIDLIYKILDSEDFDVEFLGILANHYIHPKNTTAFNEMCVKYISLISNTSRALESLYYMVNTSIIFKNLELSNELLGLYEKYVNECDDNLKENRMKKFNKLLNKYNKMFDVNDIK